MTTLLIRLAGPLQSWGGESKFEKRATEKMPSKSGVIGLAAAAIGRRRNESIEDIAALRFGSRTDRAGARLCDFQTTLEDGKASNVIKKDYLSDAVFLVGLEGDRALLEEIEYALRHPVFPLFLGRRSCPVQGRVSLGLRDLSLEEALAEEPWLINGNTEGGTVRLRFAVENTDLSKNAYFLRDIPISYDPSHRKFGFRRVYEYIAQCPAAKACIPGGIQTDHDPMKELEV